jgi:hypothetical protein
MAWTGQRPQFNTTAPWRKKSLVLKRAMLRIV